MSESTTIKSLQDDPGKNWQLPPPPLPKQKPWWRLYSVTLTMVLFFVFFQTYLYCYTRSNPPPSFEELQRQQVTVLGWQISHPQLHVRLPNGDSRMVEFPTLHIGKSGDKYYVISFEQQRQLVGKTCQMWGRPLRFSIQDSYQVFALDCGDGSGLEFAKSLKDYTKSYEISLTSWRSWPVLLGSFVFCILCFWAETIRNRKDLQEGSMTF